VRDNRRIQYLQDHLAELHAVLDEGIPLIGYLVWSLLDNYEWAFGYDKRFGLVHVDFDTLARTVKNSGRWFNQVIRDNGFTPKTYFEDFRPES
jgi:beta-glucosidase